VSLDDITTTLGMTLGPFRIDASGALEATQSHPVPGFSCRWRGQALHAKLLPGDRSDWRLLLQAPLGRMPSTAHALDTARRSSGFILLRGLPAMLPEGWSIGLAADHRVLLEAKLRVPLPITATALIAEITIFLLALAPYLDVLEAAGLAAPSDPGGTANTWPG
jgi:hypothetical protein